MCGIVGISYSKDGSGKELLSPSEMLQAMLPASVHRGPHAYGWMYLTRDGVIHVAKFEGRSDTGEALLNMVIPEDPDDVLWVVGHVRYFTHGSPSNMHNNHPIRNGKIIGVHNGVLRNHRDILKETGREFDDAEVDSEAIMAAVNKWGHRKGLGRIRGDMVSVYANIERPETLHIARTHGRPLLFTRTKHGSIMFASEEGMMKVTEMVDSAPSSLSSNRLVRVKAGRIVERINLPMAATTWRSFEGGPDHNPLDRDPHHPPREIGSRLSEALARANRTADPVQAILEGSADEPATVTRPTKPARGYSRSTQFRDGDRVGSKFFYKGLLLTEDEFYAEVGHPEGEF